MDGSERLRQMIALERQQVHATYPAHRPAAFVALTRARDAQYVATELHSNPIAAREATTKRLYTMGWNEALRLCVDGPRGTAPASGSRSDDLGDWADQTLQRCGHIAEAEAILGHCETGFMRVQHDGDREVSVWVASKQRPAEWQERDDIAWWRSALAGAQSGAMRALRAERPGMQQRLRALFGDDEPDADAYATTPEIDAYYDRLGRLYVAGMACHYMYPADAVIGGCAFQLYLDILATLIGWALRELDLGAASAGYEWDEIGRYLATPRTIDKLVAALAARLAADMPQVQQALRAFILDEENEGYHGGVPAVAASPLLRLDSDRLIWSIAGLLGEPFFFVTRELKRLYGDEYHSAAALREAVFRHDLYALFSDKRFVTSASTIELRRAKGNLRTNLDALIFDRKTGTLGIFELKSQDPFPRSARERAARRDYFYGANRQVLACHQWIAAHGADDLLNRIDAPTAKRFRVHKVYLFVLGRYLAHFADGPAPDKRAAWGTWPQVLRLAGAEPFPPSHPNPLAALHARLVKDIPLLDSSDDAIVRAIRLGDGAIRIYPSFAAYRGHAT